MQLRDAFISYGRAESKNFAAKLHNRLRDLGYNIWFDQNDIPLGVDFQNQIDDGIEKAHNFLYIIAPHALKSEYCLKEVVLAIKRNKRIIPILHIEPSSKEVWDKMHPVIGKLNWVYMREKFEADKPQNEFELIDDFDKSFDGLVSLMKRHEDYVKTHTKVLTHALEWERNQKLPIYLVEGQERFESEAWLNMPFKNEQAPCIPTDLHCEYIAEAQKQATGRKTDVFICYARENFDIKTEVRMALMRYGITSWTDTTDLKSGQKFEDAILEGIENASNFLYLISPASVSSEFCLKELDYVLKLNKRIIPMLVVPTESDLIPKEIRGIQYVDATNNKNEGDLQKDLDTLLAELQKDRQFFDDQRDYFTKALKWEKQHENPALLLRGFRLLNAQTWLKLGQNRRDYQPLPLHQKFIVESETKKSELATNVFIGYAPQDIDFARQLNNELNLQGKVTWFDQMYMDVDADIKKETEKAIEEAENVLFVLSPNLLSDENTLHNIDYAQQLGKRILAVLYKEINKENLSAGLNGIVPVNFQRVEVAFNDAFGELVRMLDTDREHLQKHTKYAQKALEWIRHNKSRDYLLRGADLLLAEAWRDEAVEKKKSPKLSQTQEELLGNSRKTEEEAALREIRRQKRLRILAIAASIAAVLSVFLAIFALEERSRAVVAKNQAVVATEQAVVAKNEAVKAKDEAIKSEKKALQAEAFAKEEEELALANEKKALKSEKRAEKEALKAFKAKGEAEKSSEAAHKARGIAETEKRRSDSLKLTANTQRDEAARLRFVSKAKELAVKSSDINPQTEAQKELKAFLALQAFKFNKEYKGYSYDADIHRALFEAYKNFNTKQDNIAKTSSEVRTLVYLENQLFTGDDNGNVLQWNPNNMQAAPKNLGKHNNVVRNMVIAENRYLICGNEDFNVYAYDLKADKSTPIVLRSHAGKVWSVAYSTKHKIIISSGAGGKILLTPLAKINGQQEPPAAGNAVPNEFAFGMRIKTIATQKNGSIVVFGDDNGGVWTWDLNKINEKPTNIWQAKDAIHHVVFSPNDKLLAIGVADGTLRVMNFQNNSILIDAKFHRAVLNHIAFNNKNRLITVSFDGRIMLWDLNKPKSPPCIIEDQTDWIREVAFSPDDDNFAFGIDNKVVEILPSENASLAREILRFVKPTISQDDWEIYFGDMPYQPKITTVE